MNYEVSRQPVIAWSAAQAARTLSTWRRLLSLAPPEEYQEDVFLFQQGDEPREVFIIASGIVKLTCDVSNGQKSLLTLRYPGDFVEVCTNDVHPRYPMTGTTVTRCEIHRLQIKQLSEAGQRNHEVNAFENHVLKRDLYNLCIANVELKTLNPIDLLEHALWDIARVQTGNRWPQQRLEFVLPLKNSEMAEWLGISESHYKQVRSELEQMGHLRRNGRRLLLLHGPSLSIQAAPRTEIRNLVIPRF